MCDLKMWDKACVGPGFLFCAAHDLLSFDLITMFFLFFFHQRYYALLALYSTRHHRIFAFLPSCSDPLFDCAVECRDLKPEASPAGSKTAAVHDTCSPKKNSFICFISLLLTLNFTPLLPTHPLFFSSGPPTTRSWTGDPPRGPVLNPSLTSRTASSSSSLKALWNPVVSDNQWHLSQEPAAQTEMDVSKKGPNSGEDSEKKPRGSCWGRLFKSYPSNKSDSIGFSLLPNIKTMHWE